MTLKKTKSGKVYLVGAGPGDPGLITVRGVQLLSQADIIFYDNLVNSQILNIASPDAKLIYVGKRGEGKSSEQKEIEDQIVQAAKKGKIVIRLKGGDPFIFGRGGEEAERLSQEKIPFEIVPGVTSAISVPAYAGIPLTHRDFSSTVVFVTGHSREQENRRTGEQKQGRASTEALDWSALAKMGTLVFLMGVKTIRENMNHLIQAGRNPQEPCALIRWGTYPKQKTWISTIEKMGSLVEREKIMPPAILVVGEVVKLREKISWFEAKPLFGKRIVVTSSLTRPLATLSLGERAGVRGESNLAMQLIELGAEVIQIPTIEIHPPRSFKRLDQSIRQIKKYDWIVFTSVHGIEFFFERFQKIQKDLRKLSHCQFATVGKMTAKVLNEYGIQADLIPSEFNSDALGKKLSQLKIKGKRILIPQAKEGKKDWIESLKKRGAKVERVEAYHVIPAKAGIPLAQGDPRLRGGDSILKQPIDLITFTSSSAVERFVQVIFGRGAPWCAQNEGAASSTPTVFSRKILQTPCLCIGPTTEKTAKKLGFSSIHKASQATLESLISKVLKFFKN